MGDTLAAFQNGFMQAIVLGSLIGLSEATALRDHTRRWMWWFAANLTPASWERGLSSSGKRVLGVFVISTQITASARCSDS